MRFKKEFGSKQKSLDSGCPSSPTPKPTMADKCFVLQFSSGELSASGSSSASGSERECPPPSEGGDTEPFDEDIDDNDDSSISESPPCSQAPSAVVSVKLKACQLGPWQSIKQL